jgi:hypothetical protein
MKKFYFFALLNVCTVFTRAQYFQWAKAEGLWAYDYGYGTGTDNSGNLYVSGKYEVNGANFSGSTVTCAGNHDAFLVKYDPSGNPQWVRTAGGTLGDYSHAMCVDNVNSAVYTTGEIEGYNNPIYFSNSTTSLTCIGDNNIFLAKYDFSGNLLWAKSAGYLYSDKGLGITTDNSGNIYMCGYFTDTTMFNGTIIPGYGGHDIYVAKYDANGNFLWLRKAGSNGRDEAKAVKCDAAGNVYICGMYSNNATFETQTFTCTPNYFESFLAKYDPNGNLQWVKKGGGDFDDVAWGMAIDSQDKIYITGEFIGYGVFGSLAVTTVGAADVFVLCYDSNGNEQWIKSAGGSLVDRARGMGTDGTNLFITGQFGSTANFGANSVTAADSSDIFISAMDNSGNFLWTSAVGGIADSLETLGYESGNSVCAEASGNVYATGSLLDGGSFGPWQVGGYKRTDAFVTKLNATPAGIKENYAPANFDLYPNPAATTFNIRLTQLSPVAELLLYNNFGQLVTQKSFKNTSQVTVNVSDLPNGIYFAEIKNDNSVIGKRKIIVQH